MKNERENENCGNMPKVTEQSEAKAQLRILAADLEATQCCSAQQQNLEMKKFQQMVPKNQI